MALIALSTFYYFVLRPIQKDKPLNDCLKTAETSYQIIQENNNRAFTEGKINAEKKSEGFTKAYFMYLQVKDDCYKKYLIRD